MKGAAKRGFTKNVFLGRGGEQVEMRTGIGRPCRGQESNGVSLNVAVSGISVHLSVIFLPAGLLLGIVLSAGGFLLLE